MNSMNVDLVLDWDKMEVTLESRKVTFYSRSRKKLWQKGETSGNTLDFVSMEVDCDRDALLISAVPQGP